MITKATLLQALNDFRELSTENLMTDSSLRIRQGNYEYIFRADAVNYVGDGGEFLIVTLKDEWTNHGATLADTTATFDGAGYLERGSLQLGGQDFQIEARVFESSTDMLTRRKIFELYTSADLTLSLYSSGAGKNLDLFAKSNGATLDEYSEPAILELEYTFKLKWRQTSTTLILEVDDTQIYSRTFAGFATRQTFDRLLLGASVYHGGANWRGTIADFQIYDGFAEA